MAEMCWDSIEQRGTWQDTDGEYLWMRVAKTLDFVAFKTMMLILFDSAHAVWFEFRLKNGGITLIHTNILRYTKGSFQF